MIKKYLKALSFILIPILFFNILFSFLNYIDIDFSVIKYMKIIILISSLLLSGLYLGNKVNTNQITTSLLLSGIIVIFLSILNILFLKDNLSIKTLLYYLIIIVSITLGSLIKIKK